MENIPTDFRRKRIAQTASDYSMLTHLTTGTHGPNIFFLHWLGGSARTWHWVAPALAAYGYRVTALDLPGFGDDADHAAHNVTHSSEVLLATLRALRADDPSAPWLLCGHSMGGKFASIVARASLEGDAALAGLRGLFLVSPSPPSPEPMDEDTRNRLIATLGNDSTPTDEFRKAAEAFLHDNTGAQPLQDDRFASALADLLRLNRDSFRAWMTTGSREDWSTRVRALDLPAVVLAGDKEGPLCAKMQATLLPEYLPYATLVTLHGGGHLSPLERPYEVADRIATFAAAIGLTAPPASPGLTPEFEHLLHSDQTSARTRAVMEQRLQPPPSQTAFTPDEMLTLRALVRAVVPHSTPDLALHLSHTLEAPQGNGWRFDDLPAPLDAWKRGLLSLDHAAQSRHAVTLPGLNESAAAKLIEAAAAGKLSRTLADTTLPGDQHATLTAKQMQHWIEDVRGECAKHYVADPRTMDRIGFHGFADDHGFTQIRLEQQA